MIHGIDGYTGDVDGARSEKAAFPMPAVVRRSIETAARERACIDKFWLLRIERNATWRSGRQSLRAAIVPIATAIVSNEQPAVIRREEYVSVVGRIDSQRVPVLAAAVIQLSPSHSSPVRGPAIVFIGASCRCWTLEHSVGVGSREASSAESDAKNETQSVGYFCICPSCAVVFADGNSLSRGTCIQAGSTFRQGQDNADDRRAGADKRSSRVCTFVDTIAIGTGIDDVAIGGIHVQRPNGRVYVEWIPRRAAVNTFERAGSGGSRIDNVRVIRIDCQGENKRVVDAIRRRHPCVATIDRLL